MSTNASSRRAQVAGTARPTSGAVKDAGLTYLERLQQISSNPEVLRVAKKVEEELIQNYAART